RRSRTGDEPGELVEAGVLQGRDVRRRGGPGAPARRLGARAERGAADRGGRPLGGGAAGRRAPAAAPAQGRTERAGAPLPGAGRPARRGHSRRTGLRDAARVGRPGGRAVPLPRSPDDRRGALSVDPPASPAGPLCRAGGGPQRSPVLGPARDGVTRRARRLNTAPRLGPFASTPVVVGRPLLR